MIREIVYLNRDNTIDVILKADGSAVDLSSVTKMEIIVDDTTTISSVSSPDAFDWSDHGADTDEDDRQLVLALGNESIEAGSYDAVLIVYDVDNPNGIPWGWMKLIFKELES